MKRFMHRRARVYRWWADLHERHPYVMFVVVISQAAGRYYSQREKRMLRERLAQAEGRIATAVDGMEKLQKRVPPSRYDNLDPGGKAVVDRFMADRKAEREQKAGGTY